MDDRTFDENTALDWIATVEDGKSSLRENDVYPRLRAWIAKASGKRILEIGCGEGICSDRIDLTDRHYTGIEPSPFLLSRASVRYGGEERRFLAGNAYDLPLEDGAFDAAFAVMVWHLLQDSDKAAGELRRVLRTGGHFLIITVNPGAYPAWKALYKDVKIDGRRFEGMLQLQGKAPSHDVLYLPSLDELVDSLTHARLEVRSTETFRTSAEGVGYYLAMEGVAL